ANAKLDELLVERNRAEEELADAAGRREQATAALYRLRSAADRLELRREAAEELVERLRTQPLPLPTVDDERLRTTQERLGAVERALAEREGLPPAARALAERGATLALSELQVEPGRERAVAAALGPRGSARLAGDAAGALRELAGCEAELRRGAAEIGERAAAIDVELARLEAEQAAARRRLEGAGAASAEGDDPDALAERLARLERRRETLGAVN